MLPHSSTRLNQAMREILSWLTFFVWTLQEIQIVARHNPWHLHHGHHMLKDHTKGLVQVGLAAQQLTFWFNHFKIGKAQKNWITNDPDVHCWELLSVIYLAYISSTFHRISDILRWFTSRVDGLNLSIDLWRWKSAKSKFTTNMTWQDTQKISKNESNVELPVPSGNFT